MSNSTKFLQVVKFNPPREVHHSKDRCGCCGFTSYGFVQHFDGKVQQIKNPDFNWRKAYANRIVGADEFPSSEKCWV